MSQDIEKHLMDFIKNKMPNENQTPIKDLFNQFGHRFFSCPASTKYHGNHSGGLSKHTLNVIINSHKIAIACDYKGCVDELFMVALLHDFGKIGTIEHARYLKQTDEWRIRKLNENYYYNPKLPSIPHEALSIWYCQKFDVKLSINAWMAIFYHNGLYVKSGEDIKMREPQLQFILHSADMQSLYQEGKSTGIDDC